MRADFSLAGKTALVCGGSSGIGRAVAEQFAAAGARVFVLARRVEALDEVTSSLSQRGAFAQALVADLEDRQALRSVVDQALALGPIHILVNNAGGPPAGPLLEAEPADYQRAFARHVLAPAALVSWLLPAMKETGYGRIINIVSTSVREPIPNLGVSNTIRGAVASFAKTLSLELPPGITVNNVLPGFTDTPRLQALIRTTAVRQQCSEQEVLDSWIATIPEGRLANAHEVAAAVVFLASPAAAYIRGVSLPVDGGRLRSI